MQEPREAESRLVNTVRGLVARAASDTARLRLERAKSVGKKNND